MKVLFLTSRFPYPPFRGDKLKMYHLIRQMAKYHEVILLSFIENREEERWKADLEQYCRRVEVVYQSPFGSIVQSMAGAVRPEPFQVSYFSSDKMRKAFGQLLESEKPDLIHTHLIRMAPYAAEIDSVPRVLDLTDAVSLYLDRFREARRNPIAKSILSMEYRRMVRFEAILSKFDKVLVCSEVDRQVLLNHAPGSVIELLWNGVDLETFSPKPEVVRDIGRIIFTGNMSYFPNGDGASYLVNSIFPLIRQKVPGARVFLVGQNPPRSIRALASDHVIVTGFVEDIRTEYLKSSVAVSPIRFGAGTLNKVLEPLALGIPVVASPQSVEGLDLKGGEEILVANGPEEFAQAVVRILTEPALSERLSHGAVNRIRAHHDWNVIGKQLDKIYRGMTNDRAR